MVETEIGLSMLYCLGKPFSKMTEQLAKAETVRIEIVDDGFHALDRQRVSILKDLGETYGLNYSVHAPFADVNIASPSNTILKAMLKRLEMSIVHASALNAYVWVFHPGAKTGISMFYPGMDWLQNRKTAQRLYRIAEEHGVKIALENVPEPFPFVMKSVEHFTRFYDEVNEDIDMALDVGHANLNGQTESFLETLADRIVHVHVSDNNGESDQHLGIGYGKIDWQNLANMLRRVSYDGIVVVESVEHVGESVKKLRQLFH
jgi:sugar phosphate isomerase/epimerase